MSFFGDEPIRIDRSDLESAFNAYKSLVGLKHLLEFVSETDGDRSNRLQLIDRIIGRYEKYF